jgi:proteic killer suppression protein
MALRDAMSHALPMIKSFQHKGLMAFYKTGSTKGIQADHAKRLARLLPFLDRAMCPGDMDLPGLRLHPLKGDLMQYWSVTISGNWRVIFRFDGTDVELVDYLDYH